MTPTPHWLDYIERQAIAGERPTVVDTLELVAEVRRLRAYGVSDPYRPADHTHRFVVGHDGCVVCGQP